MIAKPDKVSDPTTIRWDYYGDGGGEMIFPLIYPSSEIPEIGGSEP
jgi:hypothetical protein